MRGFNFVPFCGSFARFIWNTYHSEPSIPRNFWMSSVEPERMLLHYRIINKVGEGGMGQVYRAEDTKLGRYVALKLLAPEATRDQTAKRRLLSEAPSASVLNHPNIVTIHAIEEADGVDFIVMELVEGDTLTAHLATDRKSTRLNSSHGYIPYA